MANIPSLDIQAKVVSDAAQNFVEHYYESLNKRHSLAQYYASTSAYLTAASVKPDISINGRVLESVAAYEALLEAQGGPVYYDVASFDAHPVNPNYGLGCPDALSLAAAADDGVGGAAGGRGRASKSIKDGDRLSFTVQVSGTVRYGKAGEGAAAAAAAGPTAGSAGGPEVAAAATAAAADAPIEKAFNESWLLVPHWEALGRNAARGLRKWVVVSQNFRAS
ncbi:nuclear transport factor 2 domain-containing protein [Xylariaceae sp. FL1651]|nr:nuclear transport factor 2 domain-containing protein [Xylariaceae sp. FL1651]